MTRVRQCQCRRSQRQGPGQSVALAWIKSFLFDFKLTRNSARRLAFSLLNECGHATLVRTKKCEVGSLLDLADLLHGSHQPRAVFRDEFCKFRRVLIGDRAAGGLEGL